MKDIESDYWKDIFTHAQHRNMCRIGAERLSYQDAPAVIEEFNKKHPEINAIVNDTGSYITWETSVTKTISLRLFIQSQVKGTLLQYNKGEQVKIADAKFINNPFPEVEAILANREKYEQDLKETITENLHNDMKVKVGGEFIKAYLIKKCSSLGLLWTVIPQTDKTFKIEIQSKDSKRETVVDFYNFREKILELI